ncbi:MAG: transcriptional repressor [Proteobacteria bacterium]|nr:transcriptional repressor [Pseudomonadota bacterium]MCP4918217.1 transcriptional repressor [Pseudomonadota bacterium]
MSHEDRTASARKRLAEYMAREGKRNTRQRDGIVNVFLDTGGHLTLNELLALAQKKDPGIGFATVYRTMKMLAEAGVADERKFGEGQTRYELSELGDEHHDHLICGRCGRIYEFEDEQIEQLQEAVAARFGIRVTHHRHEIYGVCIPECAPRD